MRGRGILTFMYIAVTCLAVNSVYAESSPSPSSGKTLTKSDIDMAVKASALRSKKIHDDSLRVWKSFKDGDKPNYAYYYWARNIIFNLKKKQNIQFKSEDDVKKAFQIMADEDLISSDSVPILAKFVWENIERRKGMSPLEKIMPDYRREKENIAIEQLTQSKQES
ncbi:MAG: hypothetical protein KF820_00150 [Candidatus Paracaedibacteraceae bacterium]|nr:hypothetical protein [Candidatus Paracaedibacteraceae bacterium]